MEQWHFILSFYVYWMSPIHTVHPPTQSLSFKCLAYRNRCLLQPNLSLLSACVAHTQKLHSTGTQERCGGEVKRNAVRRGKKRCECELNVISSLRELKFNAYNDNGVYLLHTQNLEKLLSAAVLALRQRAYTHDNECLFVVDPRESARVRGKKSNSPKIVSCKSRGI